MADKAESKGGDSPYYYLSISKIQAPAQEVLEEYSQIPPAEILSHVHRIRDLAWETFPYPCVGFFKFLDPMVFYHERYQEVLSRVKQGQKLLDLGCCFAQSVRRLVYDGAPAENIYATDLNESFIDFGFELFRDRGTLRSTFLTADIFDAESDLRQIDGSMDIIWAWAFFHIWGWEDQKKAGIMAVKLLNRKRGSVVVGGQVGHRDGREVGGRPTPSGVMYLHNVETFKKMWTEIGETTGTTFKIDATTDHVGAQDLERIHPAALRIMFSVEVVERRREPFI